MREIVQWQHAGVAYSWADGVLSARRGDAAPRFLVLPGFPTAMRSLREDWPGKDASAGLAMIANGALESGYESEAAARLAARGDQAIGRAISALRRFAVEQVEALAAELEQLADLEP